MYTIMIMSVIPASATAISYKQHMAFILHVSISNV